MARKKTPINRAREDMKKLGIYRPEFEPLLEIYGQLCTQYEILTKKFIESEYKFDEDTQAGSKKAPIVTTLESLRKDILAYAAQLGLTPQGLLKIDDRAFVKEKSNPVLSMLKGLETG